MKKIKTNILINMFVPIFGIVMFFYNYFEVNIFFYGDANLFIWILFPICMFIYNTFTEKQIKKLILLYIISSVAQSIGILIESLLYYFFYYTDMLSLSLSLLAIPFTIILNLVLSLIGIGIKSLILRFKK